MSTPLHLQLVRTAAFLLSVGVAATGCRKPDEATPPSDAIGAGSPCDVEKCGPPPGMPNSSCGDGTYSGPSGRCLRDGDGSCGWEILTCANPDAEPTTPPLQPVVGKGCQVGGCSGTVCTKAGEDIITTCEWREEYSCYQGAECKVQADGHCGWTQTDALAACLANPGANPSANPSSGGEAAGG